MTSLIPRRLLAAAVLAALALPQPSASALAAIPPAPGPCVAGWRELPVPDAAFISTPFEVVTHNDKAAWIVGGSNKGVLALRRSGAGWKRTAATSRGHRGLVGADAVSAKAILGVGYFRAAVGEGEGSLSPISGRVVGSAWKNRPVPEPPGPRSTFTGVATLPGGRAWAVGTRLESGRLRAWSARWNGSRWLRSQPPGARSSGLLAIDRSPNGKVWAVGWQEPNLGRTRPYIVRRDGNRWREIKSAGFAAGNVVLTDVDFRSGRDGLAVGYIVRKGTDRHTAVLQRWDGSSWSRVALPWSEDFSGLPRSVSMGPGGRIWIAGTQLANDNREARGFIASYDGSAWSVDVLGVPAGVRSEVMDVAATGTGAVAAANVGASLLVLERCGAAVTAARGGGAARAAGAGGRHRIRVGNMAARRAAVDDDGHAEQVGPAERQRAGTGIPGGAFSVAGGGAAVSLAAPVKPKGFVVRNMAAASGLKQWTKTYDGFAVDFDGNGYRDVFYSRHGGILPRLAMNDGGRFSNAPASAFSTVDRHGCTPGDVDRDGNRDILCVVGASRGKAIQRHELTIAPDKAKRALIRSTAGIADPLGRGRNVALFKLDGDAWPEAFITNAPDRDDGMPSHNRFYRNVDGRFVPDPSVGLDSSHGGVCVAAGDFDGDGDEDLAYCTQYSFAGRSVGLRFMRNEGGVLRDRTAGLGIRPMADIDVAFADVDGDGRRDLIQLSKSRLRVSKWTKNGYRKIYEAKIPNAWALAAGDASGDGRADIYVVRGTDRANLPDRLLVSRNGGRKFQSVRIPQTKNGSADGVIALDYDRNGHTDFVVLNGRRKAGPVQLLASFPS